jgi:hypothetical protein
MTGDRKTLTTAEYSQISGVAPSTVARMLRQGKLNGAKRGGKWVIHASERINTEQTTRKDQAGKSSDLDRIAGAPLKTAQAYDVEAFARLTYLTEKGVRQWLKTGRLYTRRDDGGRILVDAANLDRPEIRHLIRK